MVTEIKVKQNSEDSNNTVQLSLPYCYADVVGEFEVSGTGHFTNKQTIDN